MSEASVQCQTLERNMPGLWTLLLLLLGSAGGSISEQVSLVPPAHVHFSSVDYKTSLTWTPSSNNASLRHYVQWKIYGEPRWLDVDHCQGIEGSDCDLSQETSEVTEWYYARVHSSSSAAKSAWATSRRFSPRWDSTISPPLLRLNATQRGIVVRVKPPRALVRSKHRDLYFKIYLTRENGEEEELEMACCLRKRILRNEKRNAKLCIQAQTILPLQARSSARSRTQCVTSR